MKLFFLIFSEFFLYFKDNLITINSIKFSKNILKNPKNYQKIRFISIHSSKTGNSKIDYFNDFVRTAS